MLIVLSVLALILMAVFICGVSLGRTGRDQLRLELANLKGKHETLTGAYQDMRRIAGEAWTLAHERHFPEKAITPKQHEQLEKQFDFESVRPNYVAPEVKFCPGCSVSVRADTWPQECPACGCTFGFNE